MDKSDEFTFKIVYKDSSSAPPQFYIPLLDIMKINISDGFLTWIEVEKTVAVGAINYELDAQRIVDYFHEGTPVSRLDTLVSGIGGIEANAMLVMRLWDGNILGSLMYCVNYFILPKQTKDED